MPWLKCLWAWLMCSGQEGTILANSQPILLITFILFVLVENFLPSNSFHTFGHNVFKALKPFIKLMVRSAWTIWLFRFMGFRAKSGTEWTGYPLDCYDYWSTCGAETISLQFHVSICLPRIGLFPRHIRHTHRHHLHPLLELLRDYVRINHHHHHHPYHHHHHHHTHRHHVQ